MASYKKFVVELASRYNADNHKVTYERSEGNYNDVFEDGTMVGENNIYHEAAEYLKAQKKPKIVEQKQEIGV